MRKEYIKNLASFRALPQIGQRMKTQNVFFARLGAHIFVENAFYYSAERNRLVHFIDEVFQQSLEYPDISHNTRICITIDDPQDPRNIL